MKSGIIYIAVSTLCSCIMSRIAVANGIVNTQATNQCGLDNIQVIVGGKVGNLKVSNEQNSKCIIYSVSDSKKPRQMLKLDKSANVTASQRNNAIVINLNDPATVKDRNFILQSELKKAVLLKDELLNKKKSGIIIDDLQLNRLDADIVAIKNEISR